jgi:hypothetical protein
MPTVLRVDGFRVIIFLPPREHDPAHVHIVKANGEIVIELASDDEPQRIRDVYGMKGPDAIRAFRIVEEHSTMLWTEWRKYHGD